MYDNPPPDLPVAVLATFAAVWALLHTAHGVADHWVQTDHQAVTKGAPGWRGRAACAAHVATYTLTAVIFLAAGAVYLGLPLDPALTAVGLGVSAVSHYIADRREPLRRVADALGKRRFVRVAGGGINGAYLLDQSWHGLFLVWSALIIASGPGRLPLTVAIGAALTAAVVVKVRRSARTADPAPPPDGAPAAPVALPAPREPVAS